VWDLRTDNKINFNPDSLEFSDIAFDGNSESFVTQDCDYLTTWNVNGWNRVKSSFIVNDDYFCLRNIIYSIDNRFIVARHDNKIYYFDSKTLNLYDSITVTEPKEKFLLALSPDSVTYATGTDDGVLRLYRKVFPSHILKAELSVDSTYKTVGSTVYFTDETIGEPKSWRWYFGEGGTSSEQNPSHLYQKKGTFTVKLIVSDDRKSDTLVKNDYITIKPVLKADFKAMTTSGLAPLEVQFVDLSGGDVTRWEWNFGDGHYSEEQNPLHIYTEPGDYTVWLNIFDGFFQQYVSKEKLISCLGTGIDNELKILDADIYSYPNPFTSRTTIEYNLKKDCYVSLYIYNSLGSIVQSAIGEWQQAGEHQYRFSGEGLSQGIYFYKLEADGEIRTGNLVLVK
jgi:PKD repeat protein